MARIADRITTSAPKDFGIYAKAAQEASKK
jgi:hypothetical protein